jgi:pyruvate/2-oxoglutarate dehydrogenase complex dihydrolipoamide dehydrogenase (E3) component
MNISPQKFLQFLAVPSYLTTSVLIFEEMLQYSWSRSPSQQHSSDEDKMARRQYDITIIGGGSGGLTAARLATALGANVLLVDKERLGGDCLNYGCVPSKSLIHVARVVRQAKEAMSLGLAPANLGVDMARVTAYVQGVISRVAEAEQVYIEGVTVKFGKISFKSPTELVLNGEDIICHNTLIATGSRPAIPKVEGLQEVGFFTNEDVFNLMELPPSLIIVGGGPVGVGI